MNILDLLIIVFLILGTVIGYRKGLILQAMNLLGYVVALVVAFRFATDAAPFIGRIVPFSGPDMADGSLLSGLFDGQSVLYTIIAFLLLFILTKVFMSILARILHGIAKLPGLNLINRLLGGGLGLVQVALFSFITIHVLKFLPWETGQMWVEQSSIALWLLEQSPLFRSSFFVLGLNGWSLNGW